MYCYIPSLCIAIFRRYVLLYSYWLRGAESFLRSYQFLISSRKFPAFLKAEFHCHVHKTPKLLPTRRQIIPFHAFKIHNDFPSALWSSWWALSFRLPTQNPLPHTCYMPRPNNASFFDRCNHIRWVQITKLLTLQSPATLSLLGRNISPITLFSNTLRLCSSFNVTDQVSHPFKTAGKN